MTDAQILSIVDRIERKRKAEAEAEAMRLLSDLLARQREDE